MSERGPFADIEDMGVDIPAGMQTSDEAMEEATLIENPPAPEPPSSDND